MEKVDFNLPYTVQRLFRDDETSVEHSVELDFMWDDVAHIQGYSDNYLDSWKHNKPGCVITLNNGDVLVVKESKEEIGLLWREFMQSVCRNNSMVYMPKN